MNKLNHWEQQLHESLAKHEAPLPADGWSRLEKDLAVVPRDVPAGRKHRPAVWLWGSVVAAAACVVLVFLLDFPKASEVMPVPHGHVREVAAGTKKEIQTADCPPAVALAAAVVASGEADRAERLVARASAPVAARKASQSYKAGSDDRSDSAGTVNLAEVAGQESAAMSQRRKALKSSPAGTSALRSKRSGEVLEEQAARKKSRKMTLALAVEGGVASSDNRSGYVFQPVSGLLKGPGDAQISPDEEKYSSILIQNTADKVSSRIHHKPPLRLTVMAGLPLGRKWSLDGGLGYTYAQSEVTSGSSSNYFVTTQRLHYIGIPLQARYTFFSARRFGLYAAGGGRLDLCVSGRQSTVYVLAGEENAASGRKSRLGRGLWQGSLNAAVGAHYRLAPKVDLFVEPGVNYFFSDGSSLPASRRDRPLNFSLQAGLRWNIKAR